MHSCSLNDLDQKRIRFSPFRASFFGFIAMIALFAFGRESLAQAEGPSETREWKALLSPSRRAELPAQVSGVIEAIQVESGMIARKGDLLISIDSREQELDVQSLLAEQAIATLQAARDASLAKVAEIALKDATRQLARAEAARTQVAGSISDAELDTRKSAVEKALVELDAAKSQQGVSERLAVKQQELLKIAELKLSKHKVVTPISGTIKVVEFEVGEWVEQGETLVEIADNELLTLEFFVPLGYIDSLKVDMELEVHTVNSAGDPSKNKIGIASVKRINSSVEESGQVVKVVAELANTEQKFRSGQIVWVRAKAPQNK